MTDEIEWLSTRIASERKRLSKLPWWRWVERRHTENMIGFMTAVQSMLMGAANLDETYRP